jgi:hypothetical protein
MVSTWKVSTWKDQSSNGNDAVQSSQAAPGYVSGAINGLPAVQFGTPRPRPFKAPTVPRRWGSEPAIFSSRSSPNGRPTRRNRSFPTVAGGQMPFAILEDSMSHVVALVANEGTFVSSTSTSLGNSAFHLIGVHRTGTGAAATLDVRAGGVVDGTATGRRLWCGPSGARRG